MVKIITFATTETNQRWTDGEVWTIKKVMEQLLRLQQAFLQLKLNALNFDKQNLYVYVWVFVSCG